MRSIALSASPARSIGEPDRVLRLAIAAVFAVMLASGLAQFLGVDSLAHVDLSLPCVVRAVTGIPCPGCGMTRAFLLLSQLRLDDAMEANPLAPCLAAAMAWRLVRPRVRV